MENLTEIKVSSYLTFTLGNEVFAANVSKVLNILELTKITKVPKSPNYMKGVINLRGAVLPLIDTCIKFGMEPCAFTTHTGILVLDIQLEDESVQVGALVDSVQEVLEIREDKLQPPPGIGDKYRSKYISGMYQKDDMFIMILDLDLILSVEELKVLDDSHDKAN